MNEPRQQKFLIVESDTKYASWLQHAIGTGGWSNDSVVLMDWSSFARVRTAMTVRDYDIVFLALTFEESIEEPSDSLDWIRKLRSQPGFPEMIVLAEGGSEMVAVRTLRLGAADYLPKRMVTPARLQRSIKLTLRAIEKENARRAERGAAKPPGGASAAADSDKAGITLPSSKSSVSASGASHISTHTGASLARAASLATAAPPPAPPAPRYAPTVVMQSPFPAGVIAPPAAPTPAPAQAQPLLKAAEPPKHISTHTGASLAKAAKAAVSPPAPITVEVTPRDPAGMSLPSASLPSTSLPGVSLPMAVSKDSKQIAPDAHQIPGYTILQRIGESEAAAVYLAIAEEIGHNVALKVSKRKYAGDSASDTGARQILFQREFEAIAALDHPSIIDLFDYGIHDGVEYLAMEYFPCGDLKARLQNPLTADEAIEFLREIARSLKVVHDAGIIHRDLKPPNVMLRDDGCVVLIDFGLARNILGGDGSTRTGVLRGSPYYMSPEQAQGEELDARTDLYSLGVILYEMLAGKKPYLGASAIDVLQQHVMAPVPELPVHHLVYQPLLERLMSKSREQRIATCDELLSAVDKMARTLGEGMIDPETLVSAGATS